MNEIITLPDGRQFRLSSDRPLSDIERTETISNIENYSPLPN